jgi:hypothetical protein
LPETPLHPAVAPAIESIYPTKHELQARGYYVPPTRDELAAHGWALPSREQLLPRLGVTRLADQFATLERFLSAYSEHAAFDTVDVHSLGDTMRVRLLLSYAYESEENLAEQIDAVRAFAMLTERANIRLHGPSLRGMKIVRTLDALAWIEQSGTGGVYVIVTTTLVTTGTETFAAIERAEKRAAEEKSAAAR